MRHRHSVTENPGQIAGIAMLSAAVGAVTALLITPKTGRQTRRNLRERITMMKNQTAQVGDESADLADDAKVKLQDAATNAVDTVSQKANETKESTKSKVKDVKSDIDAANSKDKKS